MSPLLNMPQIFKIALAVYFDFSRESVKNHVLISNFLMGNIAICRGQHLANEMGWAGLLHNMPLGRPKKTRRDLNSI
jgi:hypothetical protein